MAADARGGAVLRYGGDVDFAPYESLDADGRPVGFQIELVQRLAARLGQPIEVRLAPWPETQALFRAGGLDLVAMVQTEARRRWARFAQSHASPAFGIYHRLGRPAPQSLQDLAGRRVAVLDRPAMNETRRALLGGSGPVFVPFDGPRAALEAVAAGEVDHALLLRAQAEPLRAAGAVQVATSGFSPRLQSYAFAVAAGEVALQQRIDVALAALERSGELPRLRERWLYADRDAAERHRLAAALTERGAALWAVGGAGVATLAGLGWLLRRRGLRVARERARRSAADARAARAEALLAQAFGAHPMAMLVTEPGTARVCDANDAACRLLGLPREAVLGRPLASLRGPDPAALARLAGWLADGADAADGPRPWSWQASGGGLRHGLVSAEPMTVDGRPQVFTMLRDVTDARERDEALRRDYDALAAALDVERRGRAAAEAARDDARAALDQHTTVLSHDLRAPLRAVQGFNGLLRGALQAGRVDEALAHSQQIDRAAQRMEAMVGALGRVARAGQGALQRRHVDMAALAGQAWALLQAAAPQRVVALRLAVLPDALCDADLAAQVWQNLLENAWKYTGRASEPRVSVDAFEQDGRRWYRVADNGAGFDMAQAGRLFQPFQRMHAGSEFAGSGVGLSLVRRIVERHGGDIRVRSQPGTGTVVEFTLDPAP